MGYFSAIDKRDYIFTFGTSQSSLAPMAIGYTSSDAMVAMVAMVAEFRQ